MPRGSRDTSERPDWPFSNQCLDHLRQLTLYPGHRSCSCQTEYDSWEGLEVDRRVPFGVYLQVAAALEAAGIEKYALIYTVEEE